MVRRFGNDGFSLTEVLIATGILTVGFILIAGTFPVGIKLTALATERTIGAVTADEAFAKIQLYGIHPAPSSWPPAYRLNLSDPNTACRDYAYVAPPGFWFWTNEFAYPSTDTGDKKKYYWSAICRHIVETDNVQVTVFVSRTMGTNVNYPYWDLDEVPPSWQTVNYPRPVKVRFNVLPIPGALVNDLYIIDEDDGYPGTNLTPAVYVSAGSILVDAGSGEIMRVLERKHIEVSDRDIVVLADLVSVDKLCGWLWVIPPSVQAITEIDPEAPAPAVTGRYPCVGVYQRELVQ
jgi:hypothetical protein